MKYKNLTAVSVLTLAAAGAVLALPIKVRTEGTKSQSITMCADCKSKVSCAMVGDYLIGLSVDLESPKAGTGRLMVHVQDQHKAAVKDAKVTANVSMPEHKDAGKTLTLKHGAHGKYLGSTNLLNHSGLYRVEVAVTPSGGDTVKQVFSFTK